MPASAAASEPRRVHRAAGRPARPARVTRQRRRGARRPGRLAFEPDPAVLRIIRSARDRGTRTALFTNNGPLLEQALGAELSAVGDVFDQLVFSWRLGVTKPDPEAFERATAALGATPAGSSSWTTAKPTSTPPERPAGAPTASRTALDLQAALATSAADRRAGAPDACGVRTRWPSERARLRPWTNRAANRAASRSSTMHGLPQRVIREPSAEERVLQAELDRIRAQELGTLAPTGAAPPGSQTGCSVAGRARRSRRVRRHHPPGPTGTAATPRATWTSGGGDLPGELATRGPADALGRAADEPLGTPADPGASGGSFAYLADAARTTRSRSRTTRAGPSPSWSTNATHPRELPISSQMRLRRCRS